MPGRTIELLCATTLILSYAAKATDRDEERLFELSLEELVNVSVSTTSKREEKKTDSPALVSVLQSQEIELLGFTSTEEIIEYITGLSSVNGEGNVFTTTSILGNTLVNYNTNTLLLVDGKSILSPYHGSFDFAAIPVSSIDRIEVVKGANSVLYGTNAINAVINVITKSSTDANKIHVQVGQHGKRSLSGSFGNAAAGLAVQADITNVGGETLTLIDEQGQTLDWEPDKEIRNINVKYQAGNLNLQLLHFNRRVSNHRTKGFDDIQYNDESGTLLAADYTVDLADDSTLTLLLQHYDWELDKAFLKFSDQREFTWYYQGSRSSAQLEYTFNWRNNYIISGLEASNNKGRRFKQDKNAFDIGAFDEPTKDFSAYLNGIWAYSDDIDIHYGARYYTSTFFDHVLDRDIDFNSLSFRAALIRRLNDNMSFKLVFGEAFRVPTYFERQVASATVQGNADLRPEESRTINLIYSLSEDNFDLQIGLFKTTIDEKITRIPIPNTPNIFQNNNVGSVTFDGLETELNFSLSDSISGFTGLSYNNADDPENIDLYKWMFSGGLYYQMSDKSKLALSYKYLSDWAAAPSYTLINPSFIYQMRQNMAVRVGINNLLDEQRDLPEIARRKETVPTIPVAHERNVFISFTMTL